MVDLLGLHVQVNGYVMLKTTFTLEENAKMIEIKYLGFVHLSFVP